MVATLDISSNIAEVMSETNDMFWNEIPFTLSQAMNDTMFDARKWIVNVTYPQAFTVRNKAFPGKLWRVKKFANKRDLEVVLQQMPLPNRGGGGQHRDYMERHATGGVKRATDGGSVAVPVDIARTGTGRIPKAKKPVRLRGKKGTFVRNGKGGSRVIVERQRNNTLRVWYVLTPQADIDKRFRFYEDGIDVMERVIVDRWKIRFNRVVRKSRVFS